MLHDVLWCSDFTSAIYNLTQKIMEHTYPTFLLLFFGGGGCPVIINYEYNIHKLYTYILPL